MRVVGTYPENGSLRIRRRPQSRLQQRQSAKQHVEVVASDQQIRFPEQAERGVLRLLGGQDRAKIGVCRDHDAVLIEGSCKDLPVSGRVHSLRSDVDCIMPRRRKEIGQSRRQCVVDLSIRNPERKGKGQFPLFARDQP